MKILSPEAASALTGGNSLDLFVESIRSRVPIKVGPFLIPLDSGAKTALARELASILLPNSAHFLYISGWMIWPSSGHIDLFDGYRRSLGEMRSLKEAPVHEFSRGDESKFTSILAIGLYFAWDVQIFGADGNTLITLSHDEWMEFRLTNERLVETIARWAAGFELDPLSRTKA